MTELLLYSLLGGFCSLVGGLLLVVRPKLTQRLMTPLIAFSAGAFLGAAFLEVLPEALAATAGEPHAILMATLAGFILFFMLERFIMAYLKTSNHAHSHADHTESLPYLVVLGDSIHNFLDGIVIALAFAASPALGLPTALAIAAHELPQEIGDFSILINQGWQKSRVIAVNIFQSLLTIPGIFIGYYLGQAVESQLPLLLGATAGIFIYISASDLIPELHHKAGHTHFYSVVLPMVASIVVLALLTELAHG